MSAKRRWSRSAEPELLTPAQFLALGAQPDGTVVRVAADAAAGVIWRLRFNAGSANAAKWEADGDCAPLVGYSGTTGTVSTAASTYTATPGGPSVVPPLAGDYDVDASVTFSAVVALLYIVLGLTGAGLAVSSSTDPSSGIYAVNATTTVVYRKRWPLTAGGTITMQHMHPGSPGPYNISAWAKYLSISPVRVVGP